MVGSGALDLVYIMGWVSNLDYFWEEPSYARFLKDVPGEWRLFAVSCYEALRPGS